MIHFLKYGFIFALMLPLFIIDGNEDTRLKNPASRKLTHK
jgi:hypothetical protein